jgi:hypothetical protein
LTKLSPRKTNANKSEKPAMEKLTGNPIITAAIIAINMNTAKIPVSTMCLCQRFGDPVCLGLKRKISVGCPDLLTANLKSLF